MAARKKATPISSVPAEAEQITAVEEQVVPVEETPVVAEEPKVEQYTLTRKMNVRKKPSLSAPILKVLDKEATVEATEVKNDWLCLADGGFILYEGGKNAKKN